MRERRSPAAPDGGLIVGLLLIGLGILFLLRQLGLLAWSWGEVWPVFVVLLGAWIVWRSSRPRRAGRSQAIVPREGLDELDLRLSVGAGVFHLAGGATELVEVSSDGEDIAIEAVTESRRARVSLRHARSWFPFGPHGPTEWWVRVGTGVATTLRFDGGAGRLDLDLSGIRCSGARLSIGAAEAHLVLPQPSGEVEIRGSIGAASLTIAVPPGVEARVDVSGLVSVDGNRETQGFGSATDRVRVRIDGGAASVRIV